MPILFLLATLYCMNNDTIPVGAQRIIKNYPGIVIAYKDNKLFFKDGSSLIYDDKKNKSLSELMASPDIEDQFKYAYSPGEPGADPINDAGRIRNEAFFKKIYGRSAAEVRKNLVTVTWCPKLIGQKILVSKINNVSKKIEQLSAELDELPEFKMYLKDIGGSFNWRLISGTNRLSMHSFGITIDINTKYSNYWQWDCKCTNENTPLLYKNKIPQKIITVFEKHGFIWGGKWLHYDTMHFEYRPELLE